MTSFINELTTTRTAAIIGELLEKNKIICDGEIINIAMVMVTPRHGCLYHATVGGYFPITAHLSVCYFLFILNMKYLIR